MSRASAEKVVKRMAELDTEFGWRPETRAQAIKKVVDWHEQAKRAVRDRRDGHDGWFRSIVDAFDELGPRGVDEVYLRAIFQGGVRRNPHQGPREAPITEWSPATDKVPQFDRRRSWQYKAGYNRASWDLDRASPHTPSANDLVSIDALLSVEHAHDKELYRGLDLIGMWPSYVDSVQRAEERGGSIGPPEHTKWNREGSPEARRASQEQHDVDMWLWTQGYIQKVLDVLERRNGLRENAGNAGAPTRRGGRAEEIQEILTQRVAAGVERCDDACPGWFVDGYGEGIQRCDECNHYAMEAGLPSVDDDDVALLPEAQAALANDYVENPQEAAPPTRRDGGNPSAGMDYFEELGMWDAHAYGGVLQRAQARARKAKRNRSEDVIEFMRDELRRDPEGTGFFATYNETIDEYGLTREQAFDAWCAGLLARFEQVIPPRQNPGPEDADKAVEKYREFHRYDPKKVVTVELVVPARLHRAGKAKWVTYRSGKVDPGTMQKPKSTFDYIHEHDAGVETFIADGDLDTDVPRWAREVTAVVQLGKCLGFCFEDPDGEIREARGTDPLPDLCCTPDGRALLVVQNRKKVLAMMWGGALGVFARGIDG